MHTQNGSMTQLNQTNDNSTTQHMDKQTGPITHQANNSSAMEQVNGPVARPDKTDNDSTMNNNLTTQSNQMDNGLATPHMHTRDRSVAQTNQMDNGSATEKEFLMSNNTTLTEEYYSVVPEDSAMLENSLASSFGSQQRSLKDSTATEKSAEVCQSTCTCTLYAHIFAHN